MVNNYTNINKTSKHLSSRTIAHLKDHDFLVMASDMHAYLEGLNLLMGFSPIW
jgi:hypothetical protein